MPQFDLGDRLRKIRRELGMSQERLAELLQVNPSTLAAWEANRNRPDDLVYMAKKLEILTGVPAAWVLGLDEPAPADLPSRPETKPMMRVMPRPGDVARGGR